MRQRKEQSSATDHRLVKDLESARRVADETVTDQPFAAGPPYRWCQYRFSLVWRVGIPSSLTSICMQVDRGRLVSNSDSGGKRPDGLCPASQVRASFPVEEANYA